jgi:hypothetical protein
MNQIATTSCRYFRPARRKRPTHFSPSYGTEVLSFWRRYWEISNSFRKANGLSVRLHIYAITSRLARAGFRLLTAERGFRRQRIREPDLGGAFQFNLKSAGCAAVSDKQRGVYAAGGHEGAYRKVDVMPAVVPCQLLFGVLPNPVD